MKVIQTGFKRIDGVPYGEGESSGLLLDIFRPDPLPNAPMPAVLWLHGGGWARGERETVPRLLSALAQRGFFVASADYRLSGVATFPAQIHDVKAAIRWLRAHAVEYGIDSDHIGIAGHSAGGHLAALAGTSGGVPELEGEGGSPGFSSAVQAVVPISAPTDLADADRLLHLAGWTSPHLEALFGGPLREHPDLVRMANPMTFLSTMTPPMLIIHGTNDETVPMFQADALYDALHSRGLNVFYRRVVDGTHHLRQHPDESRPEDPDFWAAVIYDLLYPELEDEIIHFFERCLMPSRAASPGR